MEAPRALPQLLPLLPLLLLLLLGLCAAGTPGRGTAAGAGEGI